MQDDERKQCWQMKITFAISCTYNEEKLFIKKQDITPWSALFAFTEITHPKWLQSHSHSLAVKQILKHFTYVIGP